MTEIKKVLYSSHFLLVPREPVWVTGWSINMDHFVIPFIKGICDTFGNAQLLYGFGTVALIALMPIMCIQILGVVFKIATDRKHAERKVTAGRKAKVKIIDFDYGE